MCAELQPVLDALSTIRAPRTTTEYDIHALVAQALSGGGIPCRHEVSIGPRRRIDFLCGDIGVEVKRGRPAATPLLRQLAAYARSEQVGAIILVSDRLPVLPDTIGGKPLRALSLQKLWGIAL